MIIASGSGAYLKKRNPGNRIKKIFTASAIEKTRGAYLSNNEIDLKNIFHQTFVKNELMHFDIPVLIRILKNYVVEVQKLSPFLLKK